MSEPASSGVAGALLLKLAPAGVGAFIMVAVGPKTIGRREIFLRALVALGLSYLFGDAAVAYVGSLGLEWFRPADHGIGVLGLVGCSGWGLMGGANAVAQKFRRDPFGTAKKVRETIAGSSKE
jgi:hypothetical protein